MKPYPDAQAIEDKIAELKELDDPDLLAVLFGLYLDSVDEKKKLISDYSRQNNLELLTSLIHSFKTTCGNLGSLRLFGQLSEFENELRRQLEQGQKPDQFDLPEKVFILLREIDEFSEYLKTIRSK